ncbi:hypothetical protein F5984_20145 [Rudanella paleaurantiibacter]|uniref:Uncharacterized protein n=1 Tax=Rudanella paleaurantiibacter TaxID=2614655 RepID=A0A7J5TV97_9BACT|nr:hypothetical protein [Rudanella paleaurantiibacter]KAB7728065.1 hypothetical protein F5984_20145 [Rudanella paleaurantiibacter]
MSVQKLSPTLILVFFCVNVALGQSTSSGQQVVVNNGIGLGSAIAVAISWSRNKSILWAIVHGILGWLYVIFYFFTHPDK